MGDMEILRNTTAEELVRLYKKTGSLQGVFVELGMSGKARCVQKALKQLISDTDPTALKKMATRCNYTADDIKQAVEESICMSDVLRKIGLSTHGSNAVVVKRLMAEHNIDFTHFDVSESMRRNKHRWEDEDIFVENSPLPRATLNAQVHRREVLGSPECVECGVTNMYNGKPITLTIDHINGISNDNRLENLRWLCHNCHSQTASYGGKGVKLRTKK
jgi:5-methylcytosine-specific restriction endonuclease McrA